MYKLIFAFFVVALFSNDLTHSFNPLLTYTIRFKKLTFFHNMTGNYAINQNREQQTVSVNFTCNFTEVDNVAVIFHRCDSEGINCEYFQTWKFTDLCFVLKQKNQVWSKWYGSFRPPLECPINKRNYEMSNGYVEVGPVLLIYPDATNYQWKVIQKFYLGDEFRGGYTIDFYFFGYRKKVKS